MFAVLITDPLAEEGLALLRQEARVEVRTGLSAEELLGIIGDYQALIVRSRTRVTTQVIEAGKQLRVIGRAGVAVDNINLQAAERHGVVVVNSPFSPTLSVAELTLGLMLALARHIPQAHASLCRGEWLKSQFTGVELFGKTLGIIGLGRIGSVVAMRAKGFGMQVLVSTPHLDARQAEIMEITSVSLEELLRRADFITIHTPLLPTTRGLIGPRELSLVRPTAYLINCARGGVVDEAALLMALEEGRLAGAALDVFTVEPPGDHPLFKCERVVATPHIGAMTREAQVKASLDVAGQVLAVLRGEPAEHVVTTRR